MALKVKERTETPVEKRNLPRRELIDRFMPTIRRIVLRYNRRLPPQLDLDDLVSAGVAGLLTAIDKFDPDRGARFEGYVNYHIRWAVLNELRQWDHLTRRQRQSVKRIEAAYLALERELERKPSDDEVRRRLGMGTAAFRRNKSLSNLSFLRYEDQWKGDGAEDLLTLIFNKEVRGPITRAVARLPEKERKVIRLYYMEEKTMKEAARSLAISESRASQLHRQALSRLEAVRRKLERISAGGASAERSGAGS